MSIQIYDENDKKEKNRCSLEIKTLLKRKWFIFCVAFILSLFLVFAIPIIINELYKLNDGYLTLWDASDVLAFYAVILSGIITIGALIVTIYFSKKDTEKQIKFSKAQMNTPFFTIEKVYQDNVTKEICESANGLTWQKEYIINRHGDNQGQIVITLRNIGEGIALSPCYEISILPNITPKNIPTFINKRDALELTYNLQDILKAKFGSPTFPNDFEAFGSLITLSYQNTLGVKFNQKLNLQHKWNMERNSIILLVNGISPQNIEL